MIKYGVYCKNLRWYYRHYSENAKETGPYATQTEAMIALLAELGFNVEQVQ